MMTMTEYELYHAGIKGMKWGVRRYQNKDGSLTPAGKQRYSEAHSESAGKTAVKKLLASFGNRPYSSIVGKQNPKRVPGMVVKKDGYIPPSKRLQDYIDRHGIKQPKQKPRGVIY